MEVCLVRSLEMEGRWSGVENQVLRLEWVNEAGRRGAFLEGWGGEMRDA
jgi:hypothetical protein